MQATKTFIEVIRGNDAAISSQIASILIYAKSLGIDGETELAKVHRLRKLPRTIDENHDNASSLNLEQFYRKEFNLFLDKIIPVLNTKYDVFENTIKIFTDVLNPIAKTDIGLKKQFSNLVSKFPLQIPDVHAFITELEVFKIFFSSLVRDSEGKIQKSIRSAAKTGFSQFKTKHLFASINKVYCLILTALPSVCTMGD